MKRLQLITLVLLTIFAISCAKNDITTKDMKPTSNGVDFTLSEQRVLSMYGSGSGTNISEEEAVNRAISLASSMSPGGVATRTLASSISSVEHIMFTDKATTMSTASGQGFSLPETFAYVISFTGDNGFVIASADRRMEESILAYVEHGNFDETAYENPGMALFLENIEAYARGSIRRAEEMKAEIVPQIIEKLDKSNYAIASLRTYGEIDETNLFSHQDTLVSLTYGEWETIAHVAPMIPIEWTQTSPFNEKVKGKLGAQSSDGKYQINHDSVTRPSPAGCTAVAVAQLLSHWELPASIDGRHFDWSTLNQYTGDYSSWRSGGFKKKKVSTASPEIQDQVANIMERVGFHVKMNYNPSGSGASARNALGFLGTHGFIVEILTGSPIDPIESDWPNTDYTYNKVKASLDAKCPILTYGQRNGSAHLWNTDGYLEIKQNVAQTLTIVNKHTGEVLSQLLDTEAYTQSNFLHQNWGWEGLSNGYTAEGCFDPGRLEFASNIQTMSDTRYWGIMIYPNIRPNLSKIAINIPDIVFRTEVLKQLGRTDGPITRADALTITELELSSIRLSGSPWGVSEAYIASLEGIEHFTNLEKLTVRGSRIINSAGTKMSTLNLTYFPRLRELSYTSCGATSITLVNCQHLEKIDCSNNQLLDINGSLAGLSKLKWLDCSNNKLGYGDIKGDYTLNTMPFANLKYLDCVNNPNLKKISVPWGKQFDYLNMDPHVKKVIGNTSKPGIPGGGTVTGP